MSEPARREAAVLVPVYRDEAGTLRMVLVRRSARGRHGGQLALPGGNREPGDATLAATALREASEEIGLAAGEVEILAELPALDTRTTGMRVTPFVARLTAAPGRWRLQAEEIAEVVDVAVGELADPHARVEEMMSFPGWPEPRPMPAITVGANRLWGLTLRILEPLVPRLLAGEWGV